jgi:hypothetical protein
LEQWSGRSIGRQSEPIFGEAVDDGVDGALEAEVEDAVRLVQHCS